MIIKAITTWEVDTDNPDLAQELVFLEFCEPYSTSAALRSIDFE